MIASTYSSFVLSAGDLSRPELYINTTKQHANDNTINNMQ